MATLQAEPQRKLQYGEHGKSIQEFLGSPAFIRVLLGGRGVGKTRALAEDITAHLWQNAGGKAIVARQTEVSQGDSSIQTFWDYFESLGPLYQSAGIGLFKSWNNGRTFRVPSRLAIERMQVECAEMKTRAEIAHWILTKGDALCGRIEFRGLPDADKGKFRGMECSYFALVEADQVLEKQFNLSLACLRQKGVDPDTCDERGFIKDRCVVLDSNPPAESHWIAEFEKREEKKPAHDRIAQFWHISTYENEHNLPENYIRDTILLPYANNPAMIERMLWGRYADAFDGKPVIYAYQRGAHEWHPRYAGDRMPWMRGGTCVVSQDYGTNNYSLISCLKTHNGYTYWHAMREIYLTESDTDRQALEVLRVLAEEFPFWNKQNDVCPQTLFFGDPAVRNSSFTKKGAAQSPLAVLHTHGIFPGYKIGAGLVPSLAVVNRLMQQNHLIKDKDGKERTMWHFRISTDGCPLLCRALRGEYRYPTKDEPGYGADLPLKGELCNHADHKVDGFRYGVLNVFGLDFEKHPEALMPKYAQHSNPEPARKI